MNDMSRGVMGGIPERDDFSDSDHSMNDQGPDLHMRKQN